MDDSRPEAVPWQFGERCFSDQLPGQSLAEIVDLGKLLPASAEVLVEVTTIDRVAQQAGDTLQYPRTAQPVLAACDSPLL